MSRIARTIALALLVAAAAAAAQETPDVPRGPATLRGRLVHESRPEAAVGVPVVLYALSPHGEAGLRRSESDAEGRFVFEGIANDPGMVYLVGARLGAIPFGARTAFAAGELSREVEIALSDPSTDTSRTTAGTPQLRIERGCTHLRVQQQQPIENAGDAVVYVGTEEREGREPLFAVELPEGASELETPLGAYGDGLEREGRTVRFWGPLYPGEQTIQFSYGLPLAGERMALRLGFPSGAPGVELISPQEGARLHGAALAPGPDVEVADTTYTSQRAGPLAAGGVLEVEVEVGAGGPSPRVRVPEARIWIEADDAALDVNEQHRIEVDGEGPLTAGPGGPLLCLPLPEGAKGLRFSGSSLDLGLTRDPSGALAVRGPLPAGESMLALRYRLPVTAEPAVFERHFATAVDLLTVLVADTGIVPRTERLHPRRPMRTDDRSYLHLEAFSLEPGEPVALRLERLEARGGLSRVAAAGVVGVLAVFALGVLIAPLRGQGPGEPFRDESVVQAEREAVYRSIEDLDHDHETGKLSDEDHARMRAELRARAVALLRAERDAAAPETPQAADPAPCPRCATPARAGDRFCSQCGAALGGPPDA